MYTDSKRRYKTIRLLGKGAFAEVYLVENDRRQAYACKVCTHEEILNREAGFQKEAGHPLFPQFYDFWREAWGACLLMEYVPGESLENMIRHKGRLSDVQAARIGCRLAEGLSWIHEKEAPLLFRDIKPANVMLTPAGEVKLLDFGCACRPGKCADRAGSIGFAAPEQFVPGAVQTPAADVYGLGRTLQEITAGGCRGLLKKVTERCTADNPQERLWDMREVRELLMFCTGKRGAGINPGQRAVLGGKVRIIREICEY